MIHISWIVKYSIRQIVKQIRHKPNFLERNKGVLHFSFVLSFEFNVVNDDEPLADDETKEIQELLIIQDLPQHFVVVLVAIQTEERNRVLFTNVLVQNHQNVRSVQHLTHNLPSLLGVKLFQNIEDFCNDLADSEDWFHVFLGLEVLHVVVEDFPDDLVTDHLAHFVSAHFFGNVDELFGCLHAELSPGVIVSVQRTCLGL